MGINSRQEVDDLIKARYTLLYVVSSEERRVEDSLKSLAIEREFRLEAWCITQGFSGLANAPSPRDVRDPLKALEHIVGAEGKAVYILRDFHPFFQEPAIVRKLRDIASAFKRTKKTVIILSPVQKVPAELEKELSILDWDLPNRRDLEGLMKEMMPNVPEANRAAIQDDRAVQDKIIEAALGLTAVEAENVFAKSVVRTKTFDIPTILDEKKHIIRKSGILEYQEAAEKLGDVGGLEILKDWLQKRKHAFTSRARDFGLPLPKGILLIGVPGCGKSLTAKTIGALWQMPLLRLDVGKIFGGLVGSSEENIRKVLKTSEAIAPAVLWLDELEKGFSGTGSSNMSDGGTTSRVFGSFVTWLQEKTTPVFVIATANNVHQLPPELLRKGRFDEIFFVDLPARDERRSIFEIHIKKKGRDPAQFDLDKLTDASIEFSGAEIEQAVVAALYEAFDAGIELNTEGLLASIREIVPLAVTMKENIDNMREWAKTRARVASLSGPVARAKAAAAAAQHGGGGQSAFRKLDV
ncbi:MAG: AAA family ATPase [Deltaproteobacteria bacterium]|nr:AAA family ATPase [Deltaproteobacteria bacterium]